MCERRERRLCKANMALRSAHRAQAWLGCLRAVVAKKLGMLRAVVAFDVHEVFDRSNEARGYRSVVGEIVSGGGRRGAKGGDGRRSALGPASFEKREHTWSPVARWANMALRSTHRAWERAARGS